MPRIKKAGPWNPQKATAYVGKGVLKYGDTIPAIRKAITPVPNGPLVKKNGSTLKNGGKMIRIKKAQNGDDSTSWKKRTLPSLTKQGLDYEIGRLSKMITPKSAPSVIQQKIDILKREKARREAPKQQNGGKVVKVGGQTHKVFKNKKGDIVVDHTAGIPAGKWDKINLTKKAKAKTVKQGVASVRKWHKDNPDYYKNKKNGKASKSTSRKKS